MPRVYSLSVCEISVWISVQRCTERFEGSCMCKMSKHKNKIPPVPVIASSTINVFASREYIDRAYTHIIAGTDELHFGRDIWNLRCNWQKYKMQIQEQLIKNQYQLSPVKSFNANGESILIWYPLDKVVLKTLNLYLTEKLLSELNTTKKCYHLKGGPLSVVLGTLYLNSVDDYYSSFSNIQQNSCKNSKSKPNKKNDIKYLRHMDDIIIFCNNRFTLRKVVKDLYWLLTPLKLQLEKLKTYIGKVAKGFDFLGHKLEGDTIINSILSVSKTSIESHCKRLQQLYEQRASSARVAEYVKSWMTWVTGSWGGVSW